MGCDQTCGRVRIVGRRGGGTKRDGTKGVIIAGVVKTEEKKFWSQGQGV